MARADAALVQRACARRILLVVRCGTACHGTDGHHSSIGHASLCRIDSPVTRYCDQAIGWADGRTRGEGHTPRTREVSRPATGNLDVRFCPACDLLRLA